MATKAKSKPVARKATLKGAPRRATAAQKARRPVSNPMTTSVETPEVTGGALVTPTIQRNGENSTSSSSSASKNFRNHPDMENFFRFIYENDLRLEALEIIDQIIVARQRRRSNKKNAATAPRHHA